MSVVIKLILLIALLGAEWRLCSLHDNITKELEPLITFLGALATYLTAEFWFVKKGNDLRNQDSQKKISNPNDLQLYNDISTLFSEETMVFYKGHDFSGSFDRKYLKPLFEFVDGWNNVHREFVDLEIEKIRKEFFESAKNLSNSIALNTTTNRYGFASVVPDNMPTGQRPKHIVDGAKVMNDNSSIFHQKYETLVRSCKINLF